MSSDIPHVVSTNDLFSGDLSGDELMDIYNNVDEGIQGIMFPDIESNQIIDDIVLPEIGANVANDECHPGLAMALAAAAMDEGMVLQQQPTLPTLLLPAVMEEQGPVSNPLFAEAAEIAPTLLLAQPTKKRGIHHSVQVPEAKRQAIAPSPTATFPFYKQNPMLKAGVNVAVEPAPQPVVSAAAIQAAPIQAAPVPSSLVQQQQASEASKASTEAEAKSVANADDEALPVDTGPVDTSTERIKALTSESSWMATCPKTIAAAPLAASNKVTRQNLTLEERKRQSRDRNREHARNTRLRKKAYVEEIKRTLNELVEQRDAAEAEKRKEAQHEVEQREVRFLVAEEFLKMKGRNEVDRTVWSAILEDEFKLTLPFMDFYKMGNGEKTASSEMILEGAASVMEDSKNFFAFLQTLRPTENKEDVALQFNCDRKDFFMDGCSAFLRWSANFSGSDKVLMDGFMRCTFNPASNKLVSASVSFDTAALRTQIKNGLPAKKMSGMFVVVPSSSSQQPAVVSPASPSSSSACDVSCSDDSSLGAQPSVSA